MQTEAVIKAAINVNKAHPEWNIVPEIMIPLVGDVKELKFVKKTVVATADKIIAEAGVDLKYKVGTMIEIPRAALTADKIAEEAEFFSFGTNDLTQMTFGFSRDDAGKFLSAYYENKIYRERSLRPSGPGRRWPAGEDGFREGPGYPSRHHPGHLRRARRRPDHHRVLPQCGPDLRVLLSLPCADCPPGCRAGCHQEPPQVIASRFFELNRSGASLQKEGREETHGLLFWEKGRKQRLSPREACACLAAAQAAIKNPRK